jgi:hypothetical protein
MLFGNSIPRSGPPDKRAENVCTDVDESKICFSEQPLTDKTFVDKTWKLNNILFHV